MLLNDKQLKNYTTRWSPIQKLTHQLLLNFKYRHVNYWTQNIAQKIFPNTPKDNHNQDKHGPDPPSPIKWLRNMWTETVTFYIGNDTKKYKKILDFGPYKGSGVGFDYDVTCTGCHKNIQSWEEVLKCDGPLGHPLTISDLSSVLYDAFQPTALQRGP